MYFVRCLIRDRRNAASDSACSLYEHTVFCSSIPWFCTCLPNVDTRFWYLGNFCFKSLLWFFKSASCFRFSSMLLLLCSMASRRRSSLSLDCLASVISVSFFSFGSRSFSHRSSMCFLFALSLSNLPCFSEYLESQKEWVTKQTSLRIILSLCLIDYFNISDYVSF